MNAEIIPPPRQPLHVVLWRGLEPGYYVLLGAEVLFGLLFFLLAMSWGRLALALSVFWLTVGLLLPYRGLRLWQYGWLRLRHWWASFLAHLHPARRRQVATLVARLDAVPTQEPGAPAHSRAATRVLAPVTTRALTPRDAPATWAAAWEAVAPPHEAADAPPHLSTAGRPWPFPVKGAPRELASQIACDELDGEIKRPSGLLPRAPRGAVPANPPTVAQMASHPATLRQLRAWGQRRSDERGK